MRNRIVNRIYYFLQYTGLRKSYSTSPLYCIIHGLPTPNPRNLASFCSILGRSNSIGSISLKSTCNSFRYFTGTSSSTTEETPQDSSSDDSNEEVKPIDTWEEEDEAEAEIGDGGDGGGIVLQNCPWGERALTIAEEVLQLFGDEIELYAFKTSYRGYIYVRLDKLSNKYGCPSMDEIESFSRQYKKILEEVGATDEIPDDLALEVSSPGADRLLRVPENLLRFQEMPMVVSYLEDSDARLPEKKGIFFLDSIETETSCCVWKLADVKGNRDPSAKGRPLNRKQKDWRLKLPFDLIKRVSLYVSY